MKKVIFILVLMLVVSIGMNVYVLHEKNQEYSIEGTFLYEEEGALDAVYLVFDDEGKYTFYQQGDICIDEGKYTLEGEELSFVSNKDRKSSKGVFLNDSVICNINDNVIKAERNSDVPTYINYDREE